VPPWSARRAREHGESVTARHTYRHGRWRFVHNGLSNGVSEMQRHSAIAGSSDCELLFHRVLAVGLEDDPVGPVERALGFV
jgi:hypothetical protein